MFFSLLPQVSKRFLHCMFYTSHLLILFAHKRWTCDRIFVAGSFRSIEQYQCWWRKGTKRIDCRSSLQRWWFESHWSRGNYIVVFIIYDWNVHCCTKACTWDAKRSYFYKVKSEVIVSEGWNILTFDAFLSISLETAVSNRLIWPSLSYWKPPSGFL